MDKNELKKIKALYEGIGKDYGLNEREVNFVLNYIFLADLDAENAIKITDYDKIESIKNEYGRDSDGDKAANAYIKLAVHEMLCNKNVNNFIKHIRENNFLLCSVDKKWILDKLVELCRSSNEYTKFKALIELYKILTSDSALGIKNNLSSKLASFIDARTKKIKEGDGDVDEEKENDDDFGRNCGEAGN